MSFKTSVLLILTFCLTGVLSGCKQDLNKIVSTTKTYEVYLFDKHGKHPQLTLQAPVSYKKFPFFWLKDLPDTKAQNDCPVDGYILFINARNEKVRADLSWKNHCALLTYKSGFSMVTKKLPEHVATVLGTYKYPALAEFHFLEGRWLSESKPNTPRTVEVWYINTTNTMTGEGYAITKEAPQSEDPGVPAKTQYALQMMERLGLEYYYKGIRYSANVMGQNEGEDVYFDRIETEDPNTFSFSNPDHDFPKLITYQKLSNDTILVSVSDGKINGKGFSYRMHRINETLEDLIRTGKGL